MAEPQRRSRGPTRRALLAGALIGAGGLTLAGGLMVRRPDRWAAGFVARALRRGLGDLAVEPREVARFAEDFLASMSPSVRFQLGLLGAVAPLLPLVAWLPAVRRELRRADDRIVSSFLLGSDFFQDGADRSKPVRYQGLWDPYRTPCANPFAKFD